MNDNNFNIFDEHMKSLIWNKINDVLPLRVNMLSSLTCIYVCG